MSYRTWGRASERETRAFSEKAYRRQPLAEWDARWHALSVQARFHFLNVVKGPTKAQTAHSQQPSVSTDRFPPHVVTELTTAGFVKVEAARSRAFGDRVVACNEVYDFATRLRSLQRLHLLAADQPNELEKYVAYAFYDGQLTGVLNEVLRQAGIEDYGVAHE